MGDVAEELGLFLTGERHGFEIDRILTTVLVTDIVGSTERAASLGDQQWHRLLDAHDAAIRKVLHDHRGREIKTTGDGFMTCFDGPGRAVRCAQAVTAKARQLGIEIRAGLHTGECEVRGDDIAGLAVHIAARIGALAGPGEVLVSSTVRDLVMGSGITMQERGHFDLKGVPDAWRLFIVQT
jgi:class 3 adenylate cyclase